METKTKQHRLTGELEFQTPSGGALCVRALAVTLTSMRDVIVECRLQLALTPDQYRAIRHDDLFNVTDPVLAPSHGFDVDDEADLMLEASLRPDLLSTLSMKGLRTGPGFVQLVRNLPVASPVRHTNSWFCLSVAQPAGTERFKTLWAYLDLQELAREESSEQAFSTALLSFAEAEMFTGLDGHTPEQTARQNAVFKALVDASLIPRDEDEPIEQEPPAEWTDAIDDDIAETILGVLEELSAETNNATASSGSMVDDIAGLLSAEGFDFRRLESYPVLSAHFDGQNGEWAAYAQVIEERNQLILYSVVPVKAPAATLASVAEFVTRANHDLAIGNFELDYDTGEVRFKTSIDVTGSQLDHAVVMGLVGANLQTTDQYLSGLLSVIYGGASPQVAIEQSERETPRSDDE